MPELFLQVVVLQVVSNLLRASQVVLVVKNPPANARDMGQSLGWERSPGGGNGNPLQYSCPENSPDRGILGSYSPWGRRESGTTEWLSTHASSVNFTGSRPWTLQEEQYMFFLGLKWVLSIYQPVDFRSKSWTINSLGKCQEHMSDKELNLWHMPIKYFVSPLSSAAGPQASFARKSCLSWEKWRKLNLSTRCSRVYCTPPRWSICFCFSCLCPPWLESESESFSRSVLFAFLRPHGL